MIVKKVPTSTVAPAKSKARNIQALCDYIAGPDAGREDERLEHRGALNVLNIDHDGQVQEMVDLAAVAKRAPQPVQHWIFSWPEGEQPTSSQAEEVVAMFLAEMALSEHQALFALHGDTDNCHLHLAVNRVHPTTERVVTVNGGFDLEVAHRALARIEHAQGWAREHSGRYQVRPDGQVERTAVSKRVSRQPTTRVRDVENRTGEVSAQRCAIEEAAPAIRAAQSWQDLHAALARRGMRFEQKGSGAVVWVGEVPVKASAAGRDCSVAALEQRLGAYAPPVAALSAAPRKARALDPSAAGWANYRMERDRHLANKKTAAVSLRAKQRAEFQAMRLGQRAERARIFQRDWRGRGQMLNAMRSLLAADQARARAALREEQDLERTELRRRPGRFPDFEEWLLALGKGDRAAQWRHRQSIMPVLSPDPAAADHRPGLTGDIRGFTGMMANGDVFYCPSVRRQSRNSRVAFVDRGKRILIYDVSRASVTAALQLSAVKWGAFHVTGTEQFKRLAVSVAAEFGLRILNPELQPALAAARKERRHLCEANRRIDELALLELQHASTREVADALLEPPDPAAAARRAYRGHLGDVLRDHSGTKVDASRVDLEIAIRMRVTGHQQKLISEAIFTSASKARSDERRSSDRYTQRVMSAAFAPSGDREVEILSPWRKQWMRLEGRALDPIRGQQREHDVGR